jgi:hypothetical protein
VIREQFLAGADVVEAAVSDPRVADAWERESILAGQTIGSLASHLARGAVWAVGDYLDGEPPETPVDFESAAQYFAELLEGLTDDDHAAIRARGAAIAERGPRAVVDELGTRLDGLRQRLPAEPPDRLVAVIAGNVMRLDDYLLTRVVEQVVHLDDLARSLGVEPWPNASGAEATVIACGAEIGRLRRGGAAMVRALYRGEAEPALPVM